MFLQRYFKELQQFISPCSCVICQRSLPTTEQAICNACAVQLNYRIQRDESVGSTCRLFWGVAPIRRGAVLIDYHGNSSASQLLAPMKYRQQARACTLMGCLMAALYQPRGFFQDVDLLLPVPLSSQRMRERGYNQSEEIARGLSELTRLEIDTESVIRIKDNDSQTRLTPVERQKNVEGIFTVKHPERLDGRHLLIVDDVITTGATIKELIRTIYQAAPRCVFSVLAIGRGGANEKPDIDTR